LLTFAHQIHSSSDLYFEESGYPLHYLVCICNSLSWYELIWLSNVNYVYTTSDWLYLFISGALLILATLSYHSFSLLFFLTMPLCCTKGVFVYHMNNMEIGWFLQVTENQENYCLCVWSIAKDLSDFWANPCFQRFLLSDILECFVNFLDNFFMDHYHVSW